MWCLVCEFSDQGDYCRESGVDVWIYGMATVTHLLYILLSGLDIASFPGSPMHEQN